MESVRNIGKRTGAFTLIELLTVLGVIAIISALSVSGFSYITGATALTSTGDQLIGQFNRAQQRAIAENSHIELRLYQPAGDKIDSHWSLLLARKKTDSDYEAISAPYHFPSGTVISQSSALSTLVSGLDEKTDENDLMKSSSGNAGFTYTAFRFGPDGSTDLPVNAGGDTWHLTLINAGNEDLDSGTPPRNFFTIRIDPFTGTVRTFRP